MVTVNEAINKTYSTTIYKEEYTTNGTSKILTRTDTNAAGTVTNVAADMYGVNITLAYPTPYFEIASNLTWNAVLPTVGVNGTCCQWQQTYSPTPAHAPFSTKVPPTNTEDHRGWLYTLIGAQLGDPYEQLDPANLSSLWAPQTLQILYSGCPHTTCGPLVTASEAGASAVQGVAFLLATSTTTVSSAVLTKPLAEQSTVSSSKEADPVAANSPSSGPDESRTSTESKSSQGQIKPVQSAAPQRTQAESTQQQDTQQQSTQQETVQQPNTQQGQQSTTPNTSFKTANLPSVLLSLILSLTAENSVSPASQISQAQISAPTSAVVATPGTSNINPAADPASTNAAMSTAPSSEPAAVPSSTPYLIATGSSIIAEESTSVIILSSQTLGLGSSITVASRASTTVALLTSGSHTVLQVGTSVSTLQQGLMPAAGSITGPPSIVFGGFTITEGSSSQYIVAGQTLAPGSFILVGSASSATVLILRTSESRAQLYISSAPFTIQSLPSLAGTSSDAIASEASLGAYIWNGLGTSSTDTGLAFAGGTATGLLESGAPSAEAGGQSSSPGGTAGAQSSTSDALQMRLVWEMMVMSSAVLGLICL
ncbi:hypothetical protein LTR22_019972 [Elasticomyces elasticus]|nr:hypothetical protein LTR22_019972 [Elasticomyces elasticus]